ncbi:bacterial transcriptional activator domain-containing protein [Olsenella massiliensis]|uniref:bacterial transcriptional activator domain-containing protein n=1 Tax=Olsenella massiliensis TaxID=1622075 RepID=UPI00071E0E60|nr:bacterial transcriptional activator domain-containing protein [Olsenella massiliensis]
MSIDEQRLSAGDETLTDDLFLRISSPLLRVADGMARGLGCDDEASLVVLCAETGMGKTSFMDALLLAEAQRGAQIRRAALDACGAETPPVRLNRLCRDVVSLREHGRRVAVGVDRVPSGTEGDVRREAQALRRMVAAGALVVVCLLPEADGLYHLLSEARRLDNQSLLSYVADVISSRPDGGCLAELTHGIPSLLDALGDDERARMGDFGSSSAPGRFARTLRRVVIAYVRDSLPPDEIKLRLAMILLGSGSFDDLEVLLGRLDAELLAWEQDQAPLLGVDLSRSSFSVAGVTEEMPFGYCLGMLKSMLPAFSPLATACARVLCARGQFVRAEQVCRQVTDVDDFYDIGMSWGFELLMRGKTDFVSLCLGHARNRPDDGDVRPALLGRAIEELNGRHVLPCDGEGRALPPPRRPSDRERCARCCLAVMERQRDLLAGLAPAPLDEVVLAGLGEHGELLERHLRCTERLLGGRFSDVFNDLMDCPERRAPDDVPGALLCVDFLLAEALSGSCRSPDEERDLDEARTLLWEASPGRLGLYARTLDSALDVLLGDALGIPGVERLLSLSHAQGDVMVEAVLLLLAGMGDVKSGAQARAIVRAQRVESLIERQNAPFLCDCAELIALVARLGVNDVPGAGEPMARGAASPVRDLCRMAGAIARGDDPRQVRLDVLARSSFPRELAWTLRLMLRHAGALADVLRSGLPKSWLRVERTTISPCPARMAPPRRTRPVALGAREADKDPQRPRRVRLTIMGSFSVEVDGEVIGPERLVARRARDLLALLALVKGHKTTKRDALTAIWGEIDYERGKQRLYEATSTVRKVLRARRRGIEPILSSRTDGTISLNVSLIVCDVDMFREEALLSLGNDGSDDETVTHACLARRWYGTGPSVSLDDVSGFASRHARALQRLYVSSLAAGSEAALRQGKPYLSSLLARDALMGEPRREDVTISLVEALAQLGRVAEVESMYERYQRMTARGARRRSRTLEQAFSEAIGRLCPES